MSGVRSFVALELPPHIVTGLLGAGEALRIASPDWVGEKWVTEANLHITLKFLGNVEQADMAVLLDELGSTLAGLARFDLELTGVRAVPSLRRCSMVWGTFRDSEDGACGRMAALIDEATAGLGVARDARPFTPHVTLVRARRPRGLAQEAVASANHSLQGVSRSMSVPSVSLFASTLTRRGPLYDGVGQWDLASGTEALE